MYKLILILLCYFWNLDPLFADKFITKQQIIDDERTTLISKEDIFDSNGKITLNNGELQDDFKWDNQIILNKKNQYILNNRYDLGFFHRSANVDTKICDPQTNICLCQVGDFFIENIDKKNNRQSINFQFYQLELPLELQKYQITKKNHQLIKFYDDASIKCAGFETKSQNIFLYADNNGKFASLAKNSKEWKLIKGQKTENSQEEYFLVARFIDNISGNYSFFDPKNLCAKAFRSYNDKEDITQIDCTLATK
ncbi:MAG: hypothetical protein ACO26G_04360 [Rickettsiales bacterium]